MNNRIQYALRKQAGFKWDPSWNKYLVPGGVGIGTFVLARLLGANPLLAAGLGLAGAGGTSLYQNWDTLFPKGEATAGGGAGSGNTQQTSQTSTNSTPASTASSGPMSPMDLYERNRAAQAKRVQDVVDRLQSSTDRAKASYNNQVSRLASPVNWFLEAARQDRLNRTGEALTGMYNNARGALTDFGRQLFGR